MDISQGAANDVSYGGMMAMGSTIRKTTSSWAVGSGNGGLDTGAIATSTWYHFFLIKRTDTGVVDVLFSTSASSPTMPTNYTLKRRIGSAKTNGSSQWTLVTQVGDEFIWASSVVEFSSLATTASRVSTTLTVPTGVVVTAKLRTALTAGGGGSVSTFIQSLLENDTAPSATLCDLFAPTSATVIAGLSVVTNTSAQTGVRSSTTTGTLAVSTYGWIDRRGK
jgi:hypothetical protein